MAEHGLAHHAPRRRRRRTWGWWAIGLVAVLLGLKVLAYLHPGSVGVGSAVGLVSSAESAVSTRIENTPFLHGCPATQRQIVLPGGWLCAARQPPRTAWAAAYEAYPLDPGGRDRVYRSTASGTIAAADDLMRGVFDISRYAPVHIGRRPTWTEDPYHSVYWRLNYYALRPTQSLLYAFERTGNADYATRLLEILDGFIAHERHTPLAWRDNHAVAFRAMVLAEEWWNLRRRHQLSETESTKLLHELERTGQFLADRNHYEPEHNHGTNEAAALFQLGVDFPTLPHARQWAAIARSRLSESIHNLVDADGALIENSPYYDFYTLDKYWQIAKFARRLGVVITPDFDARIATMINYATYLLQPDSSVPLLGASLQAVIHDTGSFAEMAAAHSTFRYVLTRGAAGRPPLRTSTFFPATGQTIMRSAWGSGSGFVDQSYLTFNVGAYRTRHSNLDALAITLYGAGIPLLPGAGLFSYTPGRMRRYFHGTGSHDTIVVDGRDQVEGAAAPGRFVTGNGITYQTGESSLYDGVTHRRLVLMIDAHHFLVVDRLSSSRRHDYTQMFHLFPGAHVTASGLTVTGTGASPAQSITITQLDPRGIGRSIITGQRDPPAGLCSLTYQHAIPCAQVAYDIPLATDASFITLLTIGPQDPGFRARYEGGHDTIAIQDGTRSLIVRLGESERSREVAWATDAAPPPRAGSPIPATREAWNWAASGGATLSKVPIGAGATAERIVTSGRGRATLTDSAIRADLSHENLLLRFRVLGRQDLSILAVELSNDAWTTTTSLDLQEPYPPRYDGGWLRLSLAEGALQQDRGYWVTTGPGRFDWSRVDGVRFVVETGSTATRPATLDVAEVGTIPQQKSGVVVFVFDDGYSSILPAARYLHANGMPADIAVIGRYTELPSRLYLNTDELRRLQDGWGWDMVNHTERHVDAVGTYRHPLRADTYQRDIVANADFLAQSGLNSAPNWLIYPHGSTDPALERVVGRFYKFARTTDNSPEAYPFGDPLRVKTLEIRIPQDTGDGGGTGITRPAEVRAAVLDAKRFHATLIVTFHRIHSRSSDRPGYPLRLFERIVDDVRASRIPVRTLSGLDAMMGVPEDNRIIDIPERPSQILVTISQHDRPRPGLLRRIVSWF